MQQALLRQASHSLASSSHRCSRVTACFGRSFGTYRLSNGLCAYHSEPQACSASSSSSSPALPHVSVMLKEVLQHFEPVNIKVYVDCTLGAGGHASAVVKHHPELQVLVGFDLDPTAHNIASSRLKAVGRSDFRLHFVHANYSEVEQQLTCLALKGKVDAILMDLGVSSMQIDTADRGFSFLQDGPLDMRMDPQAALSAEEIVNTWSEAELARIIRDYGEEKQWRAVARRIVEAREQQTISSTKQLVNVIGQTHIFSKVKRPGKLIHPATRTFQALRIAVNDELNKIEKAVPAAIDCLAPGGRLQVISFHSLEDRVVKHAFSKAAGKVTPEDEHLTYGPRKFEYLDKLQQQTIAKLITRKPIEPAAEEEKANPRARSAKLRVLERI